MFKGRVVALTGAGSGIGRALANEFARLGARLALSDVNKIALNETASMLDQNVEVKCYAVDVSDRNAVCRFADEVYRDFGTVDVIVNNAGTSVVASVEHLTFEEIEKVFAINLWGVIYGTKAFLPIFLEKKNGMIINISSVFGLVATPCQGAYAMSKFAVRALTETLWQELEGTGVDAILVHPGGINTSISKNSLVAEYKSDFERKAHEAMISQMITTPEACARQIINGLVAGEKRLLVGNGARALHRLSRLFPTKYGTIMKKKLGY